MSVSQPVSVAVIPSPRRSRRVGRRQQTNAARRKRSPLLAERVGVAAPNGLSTMPMLPGVGTLVQHYLGDLTRPEQQAITHAQSIYLQSAMATDERLSRYSRPLTAADLEVTLRVLRGLYAASGALRDMTPDLTLRGALLWLSVLWMQALDQELAQRPSLLGYLWYKSSALDEMQAHERAFVDPLALPNAKTTPKTRANASKKSTKPSKPSEIGASNGRTTTRTTGHKRARI